MFEGMFEGIEEEYYGQEFYLGDVESSFAGPQLTPNDLAGPVFAQPPEHMPNFEKLTPMERDVMAALPGVTDNWVTKSLGYVGEVPVIKQIFQFAQAGAEWAEKALGTAYLLRYDPEMQEFGLGSKWGAIGSFFDAIQAGVLGLGGGEWIKDPVAKNQFVAAWEASANFYETIAPRDFGFVGATVDFFNRAVFSPSELFGGETETSVVMADIVNDFQMRIAADFEHWGKVFDGEVIPDVGGLPQLLAMKQAIFDGQSPQDVQNEYLSSLGALAIRSQVWDAISQAAIDPVFFALGKLKPIERLRVLRTTLRTGKVAPEISQGVSNLRNIAKLAENTQDATKIADDFVRIADELGFSNLQEAAGAMQKAVAAGEDIAPYLDEVDDFLLQFEDLKEMGRFERYALHLTGGDPLNPPKAIELLGRLPTPISTPVGWLVKAVTLTPKARAGEFIHSLETGMRAVIGRADNAYEGAQTIIRGLAGQFGPKLGHAFVSPVGQHVQAVSKLWTTKISDLMLMWDNTANLRNFGENIAQLLGTDIVDVVVRAGADQGKGAETLYRELQNLARMGDNVSPLLTAIQKGQVRVEDILRLGEIFRASKKLVPYTDEMFRAKMIADLVESAHKIGVAQFGVQHEKMFNKMVNSVKAMESLVLLGLNVNYPVQNFFNNEVTMIARGLTNTLKADDIMRVWDDFGLPSSRLGEAYTIAGIKVDPGAVTGIEETAMQKALNLADELLFQTVKGDPKETSKLGNIFDRITQFFNQDAPKGMRGLAARGERWAGDRALTQGLLKSWDIVSPHIIQKIDDFSTSLGDSLRGLSNDLPRVLEDALRSVKKGDDLDAILLSDNINFNINTLARRAAEKMGLSTDDVSFFLDQETRARVGQMLQDLGGRPTRKAIEATFDEIRRDIQHGLDDWLLQEAKVKVEEFAAKVQTQGPSGVVDIYGQVTESIFQRHAAHMKRMEDAWEAINQMTDRTLRHRAVKALMAEADTAWNRTWQFSESAVKGIQTGMRRGGIDLGDDFVQGMKKVRGSSQDFITLRNNLWDEFFEDVITGKLGGFGRQEARKAKIYAELDRAYLGMIDEFEAGWQMLDDMFLRVLPQENMMPLVGVWRQKIRHMRKVDMQAVADFQKSIRGLTRAEKAQRWKEFDRVRMVSQRNIWLMDQFGRQMMGGDANAVQYFERLLAGQGDDFAQRIIRKARFDNTNLPPGFVQDPAPFLAREFPGENIDELLEAGRYDGIYHVTTNAPAVLEQGLKAPIDTGAVGLGVGMEGKGMVSVTVSGAHAQQIQETLQMAVRAAKDEVDLDAVMGFFDDILGSMGDEGGEIANALGAPDGLDWDGLVKWATDEGLDPYETMQILDEEMGRLFAAGWEEGSMPPHVGLVGSKEDLAKVDPGDIQILDVAAREGAGAEWVAGEAEFRFDPDDVRVIGQEIPDTTSTAQKLVPSDPKAWSPAEFQGGYPKPTKDGYITVFHRTTQEAEESIAKTGLDLSYTGKGDGPAGVLWATRGPRDYSDSQSLVAFQVPENASWVEFTGNQVMIRQNIPPDDILRIYPSINAAPHRKNPEWHRADTIFFDEFGNPNPNASKWMEHLGVPTGEGAAGDLTRGAGQATIPDFDAVVPRELFIGHGMEETWFQHGSGIIDEMERSAFGMLDEPAQTLQGLDPRALTDLRRYFAQHEGRLNDARHAAVRLAEGFRDSAMLNYHMQYGFDAMLGNWAPFGFFVTHSVFRWLIHSLDYPMMLGTWIKTYEFLENVVGDRSSMPTRLQGRIKIPMPFAPKEFGSTWVDPLRAFGLPISQFLQPFAQMQERSHTKKGRIDRMLQEWVSIGRISEEQRIGATTGQNPELFEQARAAVEGDDANMQTGPMDFMELAYNPHLPIQAGLAMANGTTDDLAPLPPTKTLKNVAGLLGITPGAYDNTWGNVRRHYGLPAFDKWEPYRVQRELSNMMAEGKISVDEALRGMIEMDQYEKGEIDQITDPVVLEAWKRTNKAQGFNQLISMVGLPIQPYPEGEEHLRELYDKFYAAIELKDSTGSSEPLNAFFDENPEFETRLALWDKPEERLTKFLVDHIWDKYNGLGKLDRKMVREQLGDDFIRGFLDRDTRAPEQIDPNQLAAWLKVLGGDPPGTLGKYAIPLEFAPPEVSKAAEAFYRTRNMYFPDWFDLQSDFFNLSEHGPARDNFFDDNPQLLSYWRWRRQFLTSNPNVVPYIDDDFEPHYQSQEEADAIEAAQPGYTAHDVSAAIIAYGGNSLMELVLDGLHGAQPTSYVEEALREISQEMGITYEELYGIMQEELLGI